MLYTCRMQRLGTIGWILLSLDLAVLFSAVAGAQTNAPSMAETGKELRRVHVFISGRVQGVGFRAFTAQQASRLNLTGWVKNLKDGRVELVAEGPAAELETLLKLVAKGPPAAHVTSLETHEEKWTGEFTRFTVER